MSKSGFARAHRMPHETTACARAQTKGGDSGFPSSGERSRRRTRRFRRGASAVEFALVGAMFCITILAGIEVGRYFMTLEGLRNYMADATRHGIVNLSNGQTACRDTLAAAMGRGGMATSLVTSDPGVCVSRAETVDPDSGITTLTVTVTMDVTFNFVMTVFGIGTQRIRDDVTLSFQL